MRFKENDFQIFSLFYNLHVFRSFPPNFYRLTPKVCNRTSLFNKNVIYYCHNKVFVVFLPPLKFFSFQFCYYEFNS